MKRSRDQSHDAPSRRIWFVIVDPDSALQIAKLLADMRSGGTTILLVTHQIGLLANLADEYLMLSHGQLVDRGPMVPDPMTKGTA